MRIVSLSPAATEIVFALGLGDELVGRTHACDHPSGVGAIPIVTRPLPIRGDAGSRAIDRRVRDATDAGEPLCRVDPDAVIELDPDLVLYQALPAGCAVGADLRGPLAASGRDVSIVGLESSSVEGTFSAISTVGAMADAEDESVGLLEMLRERLADLQERVLGRRASGVAARRVVLLQWLDPPMTSGYWVPEQVRRAGGWDLLGNEGGPSRRTTWREIAAVDPDQVFLGPCGMNAAQAALAWERVRLPDGIAELSAVRGGEVLAVDGRAYFDRPGPRIVDGIRLLAELFDPRGFVDEAPADGWLPVASRVG